MAAGTVLIVDDDADIRAFLRLVLEDAGYVVHEAADGEDAVEAGRRLRPDVILMDLMMPRVDGLTATRRLREDPRSRTIPVILLTSRGTAEDRLSGLQAGAVDYLTKPFVPDEVIARVQVITHRFRELAALSPLTGLPGNAAIEGELARRIRDGSAFSLLYCDLDHFKAINDHYDWLRGDRIIRRFAELLVQVVGELATGAFVGHVGGDDFVVVCDPAIAESLAEEVCDRFDAIVPAFYDPADRERGAIEVTDRRGIPTRYPLVSVSIGIIDGNRRRFRHPGEAASTAAEVKRYVKSLARPGSAWAVDRREVDPA